MDAIEHIGAGAVGQIVQTLTRAPIAVEPAQSCLALAGQNQLGKAQMAGAKIGINGLATRCGKDHRFHQGQAAHQIRPRQRHAQSDRAAKRMAHQINRMPLPQRFSHPHRRRRRSTVQVAYAVPIFRLAMADLVNCGDGNA